MVPKSQERRLDLHLFFKELPIINKDNLEATKQICIQLVEDEISRQQNKINDLKSCLRA